MVSAIELAPEKMTDTRSILARLSENIRITENLHERENAIRSTLRSLTRAQLEALDIDLKRGLEVPTIFKTPEETKEVRELVSTEVRSRLEQLGQDIETWYKPATWSPQTKQRMEALGWGAGIGITVVALALLWRAAKKKTKEVAKATGEKVNWLWGKMKWAIGLTVTGGLGYVGFRAFQEFRKLNALKDSLRQKEQEAALLIGEARKKADQEITEIKQVISEITKKTNSDTSKESKSTAQSNPEPSVKKNPVVSSEAQETLQEGIDQSAPYLFAKGMLLFVDPQTEWSSQPTTQKLHLGDAISENGATSVVSILNGQASSLKIPNNTQEPESRKQANVYLWNFCQTHKDRVGSMKDLKSMTLLQFLEASAESYTSAIPFTEALSGAKGDVIAALQNTDPRLIERSSGLKKAMKNYVTERARSAGISDEEIKKLNWSDLINVFSAAAGGTTVLAYKGDGQSDAVTTRIINQIVTVLRDEKRTEVHRYMLPFFHRVLPHTSWSAKTEENLHEIHVLLTEHMSVGEALRCALYADMMKNGNPVGAVLMQAEVMRLIAREERALHFSKNTAMLRMIETAAGTGTNKLIEEWEQAGIKIDKKLIHQALGVIKGTATVGLKQVVKAVGKTVEEGAKTTGAIFWEHPVASTAVIASFMEGLRQYARNKTPHAKKMWQSLDYLAIDLKSAPLVKQTLIQLRNIDPQEIGKVGSAYKALFEAMDHLPEGELKISLFRRLKDCSKSMASNQAWNSLRNFAKTNNLEDIAKLAGTFADSPNYQKTLGLLRPLWTHIPILAQFMKTHDWLDRAVWEPFHRFVVEPMNQFIFDERSGIHLKTSTEAVEAASEVSKTTKTVESAAEAGRNFDQFYDEIRAARAARDNKKMFDLLKGAAELIRAEATAGNRTAQAMLIVLKLATAARYAGKALLILGPLIDAAMITVNRFDIAAAKEAKNDEMVKTLESKERVLIGDATVGVGLMSLGKLGLGTVGIAAAPVAIASTIIKGKIYDSVVQWQTSSDQWIQKSPEELRKKLEEIDIGYVDAGHKYGIRKNPFNDPFGNFGGNKKEVEEKEFRATESVNENMRQEILTAYFLNTMKLSAIPNETEEQYRARARQGIQDRLTYVKAMTEGTYSIANLNIADERFFGQAEDYASLATMQRSLDADNKPRVIPYEWNGTMKQLDLSALNYIRTPKTGNVITDEKRQMAFYSAMRQYREEVSFYGEAIREMESLAPSVLGKNSQTTTPTVAKNERNDFPAKEDGVTEKKQAI